MKRTTRKLLSLLMVFALVCSMIPAALAEGESEVTYTPTGTWTGGAEGCNHDQYSQNVTKEPSCYAEGSVTFTCTKTVTTPPDSNGETAGGDTPSTQTSTTCGATLTMVIPATGEHTYSSDWTQGETTHYHACTTQGCTAKSDEATHTYNWTTKDASGHSGSCSTCGKTVEGEAHDFAYKSINAYTHVKYCKICGYEEVATAHDFSTNGVCACGATNPASAHMELLQSNLPSTAIGAGQTFSVTAAMKSGNADVTSAYTFTYTWYLDNSPVSSYYSSNSYTLPTGTSLGSHSVTCTVTPYYKNADGTTTAGESKSVSWSFTVKNTANVSVTIAQNQGTYAFTDQTTTEGSSIYDQIVAALGYNYSGTWYPGTSYPGYPSYGYGYDSYGITVKQTSTGNAATLYGGSTTVGGLSGVYLNVSGTGTWTGTYSVYAYTGTSSTSTTEILSGTITVKIEPATGAAILYTASIGESVDVDLNDFYTFWNEATNSRGTLQSVKINSVSTGTVGGVLCANHSAGERTHNSASGRTYYISPTSYGQTALSSLTFFPGTNSRYKTGSVTISFTATGTNYYTTGSSTRTTSYNGTITILYTNGEVQSIDYPASTGVTMLNASDFDAVYQQATGTTTRNPSYTIKFLDVPTYGTLYANYGTNNRGQVTGTEITSKNLNTLSFSNRTTGTNAISKVGYVPGYRGVGDSIRYAVYSGSTLQYVGTINFGVGKMEIKYACGASGVAFKASDFFSTSGSLLTSQYITFGTPSSGTLYKGGSARVTSADKFGYSASVSAGVQAISSVTYVPAAGFNGTVEIPFTSVTYTGGKLTGTVKITVTTKTFTDVPATHWAYAYVSRLVAEGVVSGTTPTTYSPGADVKYGEALKMILIAAGYPAQSEGSGANWASNYLTLAYNNGIVSSKNVDLNKAVDRNTIAEIAAKALKLGSASRINTGIIAPTDSTNGYVYALYNAGIVAGDSSSGRNCYYGSRSITRAEVAKVICNVSDYYSSHK